MRKYLYSLTLFSCLMLFTACQEFSSRLELSPDMELKVISNNYQTTSSKSQSIGTELKEESFKSLFAGTVKVNKLKKDGWDYGYTMWFQRSSKKVKAKYFASGDVNDRFDDWQNDKKVIMVCSGAFTTGILGAHYLLA